MPIMPYLDESDVERNLKRVDLGRIEVTKKKKKEGEELRKATVDKDMAQGAGQALIESVGADKINDIAKSAAAKLPSSKKKGSSLADFGRGLVEGVLGMPESVEGSSSRIPYALGQLPGTLARTKIGLPTSGEATHSAMQQATMPQYRQQEIGQAKVKQEIEAAQLPDYERNLTAAIKSIQAGKDPIAAYQLISSAYPTKSAELKRILLASDKETLSDLVDALNNYNRGK